MNFAFDHSYARLPPRFYARVVPTPVSAPKLVRINRSVAALLGLHPDELASPEGVAILAGNQVPSGAAPLALAYAGHQFGHFVHALGDGRAILMGEIVGRDGLRRDIQWKGSGRTPFSRGGDGRAALGPVLREYIVSEAMAAYGIPTTRTLAAVTTGDVVARETPLPGAVLTRVAASHLRVGTFEYFAARDDREALVTLVDYALARHVPDAKTAPNPASSLLAYVVEKQAALVAAWLGVGFIHGVMNTDNTTISGETIDYGPCAFLDEYDPHKVFSSIDRGGRYAFMQQPRIASWNMARFAETLLPLIADDEEQAVRLASEQLARFGPHFDATYLAIMRKKLGLAAEDEGDAALVRNLLDLLAAREVDYTIFFRTLAEAASSPERLEDCAALFGEPGAFHAWADAWQARTARETTTPGERTRSMKAISPALIPRNHRIEEAIAAATSRGDYVLFETLVTALERPYDDDARFNDLRQPPTPATRVKATFCGT